jgi:hypothetical protein
MRIALLTFSVFWPFLAGLALPQALILLLLLGLCL